MRGEHTPAFLTLGGNLRLFASEGRHVAPMGRNMAWSDTRSISRRHTVAVSHVERVQCSHFTRSSNRQTTVMYRPS